MDRVQDGNARLTLDLAKARTHRAVVDGHVGRERRAGDLRGRTERACSVGQRQRGSERVCCLSGGWDRKVARTLTGGMLGSSTAAGSPPPVLPFRGSCTRPCVSIIFLDKNRRYIGTAQSKRPPRTHALLQGLEQLGAVR
jgi:hypothetical protein